MTFRPNRYFNNPAFAQAAANLAGMFAPPDSGHAANYALANSRQAEMNRMGWLFENYDDPSASRRSALTGVQGYGQTPEGFRYNVDQNNLTQRYGHDTSAQASRDVAGINNAGALERQLLSPITANQDQRVYLPPELQERIGMPDVLDGHRSPMSSTQLEAAERQRLIEAGIITDDMIADDFVGQRTPVQTLDEDGRAVYASPGSAARAGAPAYNNPGGGTGPRMYRTPDGRSGVSHDGGLTDAHSGEQLPQGTQLSTSADTSETFGAGEMANVRGEILERRAAVESVIQQTNAIDDLLSGTEATAAVGVVGSLARNFNNIAAQIEEAARVAGVEIDPSLRNPDNYRETLRGMGIAEAQVQAALVDLAYMVAQANKPGRLNENDIQRALISIGGNVQDPQAMRQVLNSAVERNIANYQAYEGTMRNQYGDALNLRDTQFSPLRGAAPAEAAPEGAQTDNDGWTVLPSGVRIRER